jgi:hypothetical protein
MLKSIVVAVISTLFGVAGVVMFPMLAFATYEQFPFLSHMFVVAAIGFMVASVVAAEVLS